MGKYTSLRFKLIRYGVYIFACHPLAWALAQGQHDVAQLPWFTSVWLVLVLLGVFAVITLLLFRVKNKGFTRQLHSLQLLSQRREDNVAMLVGLSKDLSAALSVEDICTAALRRLQQGMALDKIEVGLLDKDSNSIQFLFNAMHSRRLPTYPLSLEQSEHPAVAVVTKAQEFCVQQLDNWLPIFPAEASYRQGLELSTVILPMQVGTQVIGCFSVQSQQENAFSLEQLDMIRSLCRQVAVALANTLCQQEMGKTKHRLDMAINTASAGLWELQPDSGELITNDYWSTMLGYQRHDLDQSFGNTLQRFEKLLHPEDLILFEKALEAHLLGRIPFLRMDLRMRTQSGHWMWVLSMAKLETPLAHNPNPKLVGINLNINDAKQLQTRLSLADQQAQAAALAKNEFLASMSHELRTPMNAIIGMSQLVMETELDDKQRNYLRKVNRSAQVLLGIINDILDFSKIEAGKLHMQNISFGSNELLQQIADAVAINAAEKNLELVFDIAMDVPQQLQGDPLRLTQILINLCSNAIKYTSSGQVVVALTVESQQANELVLHFVVQDSGMGMSSEQQQKLLDVFAQADTQHSGFYGSTGLGLSICKRLTQMMGGEIWCSSEPQQGSEFHFTARLDCAEPVTLLDSVDYLTDLTGLTVLIADDNPRLRQAAVNVLRRVNMQPFVVASAEELCATLDDGSFATDLLLVDADMPGISGQMLTQWAKRMPLILMTADLATPIQLVGCPNLVKPLTNQALLSGVANALGLANREDFTLAVKSQQFVANVEKLKGARILLVEDVAVNQELARELLTSNGMQVVLAENGEQALAKLAVEEVDGVLMDCQMPVMDGFDATRKLRKLVQFQTLPVIAMTASAHDVDMDKIISSGMNGRVLKPLNVDQMFAEMAKWITPSVAFVEPEQAVEEQVTVIPEEINIYGLDVKDGLAIVQGNGALYFRLLAKFCDSFGDFSKQFDLLKDKPDTQRMCRLVHSLKGAAGNIGAKIIYQLASELEAFCNSQNGDIEKQQQLLARLTAQLDQLISELQDLTASNSFETGLSRLNDQQLKQHLRSLMTLLLEFDSRAVDMIGDIQEGSKGSRFISKIDLIAQQLNEFAFELALENTQVLLAELDSSTSMPYTHPY